MEHGQPVERRTDGGGRATIDGDLAGRVVLVTGGTDGIGRATATQLADRGATVAIVGSTRSKGETAAREISTETENPTVAYLQADLSLMREVRELAARVREEYDRLDALVHSAGILPSERVETEEGLERSFAINYLSRFLLTNELLDRLEASAPARVINVAYAGGNSLDKLDFENLRGEREFGSKAALDQAQVANDLFGLELAERMESAGTGVSVSVVNPGGVDTDIRRKTSSVFWRALDLVLRWWAMTPEEAAETPVYLAADADPAAANGRFFDPGREQRPVPEELRDPAVRDRLWRASEELTGLADRDGRAVSEAR